MGSAASRIHPLLQFVDRTGLARPGADSLTIGKWTLAWAYYDCANQCTRALFQHPDWWAAEIKLHDYEMHVQTVMLVVQQRLLTAEEENVKFIQTILDHRGRGYW